MQTIAKISVHKAEVPPKLYSELISIYPEGEIYARIGTELPDDNPVTIAMLEKLREFGRSPRPLGSRSDPKKHFSLHLNRIYDESDLSEAKLLIFRPEKGVGRLVDRGSKGLLPLPVSGVKKVITIAYADWAWRVVSDSIKAAIIDEKLQHAFFRETKCIGEKTVTPEKLWELTSDFIMPPMSPKCSFTDREGNPFLGDYKLGCSQVEGLYDIPEPHYLQKSMDGLPPFDFALTHERFGATDSVCYPRLLGSNRFYQFCKKMKIRMDWTPVRIDADERGE